MGFKEIEINKNRMIPVPGTLQAGYPGKICSIGVREMSMHDMREWVKFLISALIAIGIIGIYYTLHGCTGDWRNYSYSIAGGSIVGWAFFHNLRTDIRLVNHWGGYYGKVHQIRY